MQNKEEWKKVIGWNDSYEVSSYGNIRRIAPGPGTRLGQNLTAILHKGGYLVVTLSYNNKRINYLIHKLVVEAFITQRELFSEENVHHKNGDKTDNRINNLELWAKYQPPGQRVEDLILFAKQILERYAFQAEMEAD